MDHIRQQIKNYIKSGLGTSYGGDVAEITFDDPEIIVPTMFPNVAILSSSEDFTNTTIGKPRLIKSNYTVDIAIYVKQRNSADLLLDALAIKLQEFFANYETLGGLVQTSSLEGVDFTQSDHFEKNITCIKYTFLITYKFFENDPTTSIS